MFDLVGAIFIAPGAKANYTACNWKVQAFFFRYAACNDAFPVPAPPPLFEALETTRHTSQVTIILNHRFH